MDRHVETYRGVAIERTAEVLGFHLGEQDQFCFVSRYRAEDDAPVLDTHPSVEACRAAIDEIADETD